jgi:hypothetical protein
MHRVNELKVMRVSRDRAARREYKTTITVERDDSPDPLKAGAAPESASIVVEEAL